MNPEDQDEAQQGGQQPEPTKPVEPPKSEPEAAGQTYQEHDVNQDGSGATKDASG